MTTCDECDGPLTDADKNAAGHYRDRCLACLRDAAADRERHVDACDDPDCLVCGDYHND